jgi:ATP sulfurylase
MFLIFLYFFIDQSAIVLVYEGKHIAVLCNLEVYAHRKEERISRQFGSAHSDHPTVKVSPSEKVLYSILNKCGRVIRNLLF